MIPPRQREAEAIAVLVDLFLNGPDEFGPEHWDTGEAAARVADEWRRRAKIGEPPVKRQGTGATMRSRKPVDGIPAANRAAVERRSGGMCEARTPKCEGRARQIHHIAGRGWKGCHDVVLLLHVCGIGNTSGCHGWIHDDRPRAEALGLLAPWGQP